MTLLIDGKPEELAQFLGLFVNDDDDTTGDDTDTNDTNDTDDDVNKRLAAEFTELMKRYPAIKDFKIISAKVDDADGEKS